MFGSAFACVNLIYISKLMPEPVGKESADAASELDGNIPSSLKDLNVKKEKLIKRYRCSD